MKSSATKTATKIAAKPAAGARTASRSGRAAAKSADPLAAYPHRLHHSTERADLVYERSSEFFALPAGVAQTAQARVLRSLDAGQGQTLQLCSGQPGPGMDGARAVYCQRLAGQASGSTAAAASAAMVPTGQLFVRFTQGVLAQTRADALAAAGCRVVSVPAYAPQAAWLAPAGSDPAQALRAIDALEALPDMVNVEPQWLASRALEA